MNTSQAITELFNKGVGEIVFGKAQPEFGKTFIGKCQQVIPNGSVGNKIVMHNLLGDSIEDVVKELTASVDMANEMRVEPSGIVQLPKSGRIAN